MILLMLYDVSSPLLVLRFKPPHRLAEFLEHFETWCCWDWLAVPWKKSLKSGLSTKTCRSAWIPWDSWRCQEVWQKANGRRANKPWSVFPRGIGIMLYPSIHPCHMGWIKDIKAEVGRPWSLCAEGRGEKTPWLFRCFQHGLIAASAPRLAKCWMHPCFFSWRRIVCQHRSHCRKQCRIVQYLQSFPVPYPSCCDEILTEIPSAIILAFTGGRKKWCSAPS